MVIMTALSDVGGAFSTGAVCAIAPELNANAPARAAIAIHEPIPRAIAASLLNSLRNDRGGDHRGMGERCKSETGRLAGWPAIDPAMSGPVPGSCGAPDAAPRRRSVVTPRTEASRGNQYSYGAP